LVVPPLLPPSPPLPFSIFAHTTSAPFLSWWHHTFSSFTTTSFPFIAHTTSTLLLS